MPDTLTPLPDRVTTPLLTLITQQSLDEDYQHVADQRSAGLRADPGRRSISRTTLAVVVLFGVLVAVAGVQTARNADVASAGLQQLKERIDTRREALDAIEASIGELRSANAADEDTYQKLGDQLGTATSNRNRLQGITGFAPLTGAGVRVTVDDAPSGDPDAAVRDDDLALLVNGLFEAGARGVAVNGHRLTALSALRNSAEVIRVNGVSLSPPYVVEAVGDNPNLQTDMVDSTSGSRFLELAADFGMPVTRNNVDSMQLPAAPDHLQTVRYARLLTGKQPLNQED